jgi:hypothetical protein
MILVVRLILLFVEVKVDEREAIGISVLPTIRFVVLIDTVELISRDKPVLGTILW